MNVSSARAFLPTLRALDRELAVPVTRRLDILRELEQDLEGLRQQLESRGLSPEEASIRAIEALVPEGGAIDELGRLHAPYYRRITHRFNDARIRAIERVALTLATLTVLAAETQVLFRVGLLSDPSPFLWPVLGLATVLFALILANAFQLWIKCDHDRASKGLTTILVVSALTLAVGVAGAFVDLFQLAGRLQASPDPGGGLVLDWLVRSSALLAVSILVLMAGGLAWFILVQWLVRQEGARSRLLDLHLFQLRKQEGLS